MTRVLFGASGMGATFSKRRARREPVVQFASAMPVDADFPEEETHSLTEAARASARIRVPRWTVRWTDAAGAHSLALPDRARVGSATTGEIVVQEPTVSRLHAEFELRDGDPWVRDLGSRNGTFVEGLRVTGARVPEGGTVRLGAATLTITAAEPATVELWPDDSFGPLRGGSVAMRQLYARLAPLARSDAAVLITGETGTGKELVARAIHEASPRARGPLVVIDCAALPENLLEAELFGHARGAFTGAATARAGSIEAAHGGTVFLDEIGELPLAMQPKLLRALETRTVRRVGESEHRAVDVRFVSATHRDLERMVNAGTFREDLYFRLAVLPVCVPPLRERARDIPDLVRHFLAQNRADVTPSAELLAQLATRPWAGNVRELRNFVDRLLALGEQAALASGPTRAASASDAPHANVNAADLGALSFKNAREQAIDAFERAYVREVLARHGGNVSAAAQTAGVDRTYLYRLIRRHGL